MDFSTLSDAELQRLYSQAPAPQPPGTDLSKLSDDQLRQMYGAPAERPAGDEAAAVGRGLIEGVPIAGPYLLGGVNRAAAGIRSLQNGTGFDEELRNVENFGRRTAEASPIASTAGQVAGGVVGTLPVMAAAPAAFGAGAGGLVSRSLISGLTGVVIGGADTAVRTDADAYETIKGAGIGAGLGLVGPGAGQLAGRGVSAIGEMVAARRAPVPGLSNPAAAKLTDDLRNAGGLQPVQQRLSELGPDAMLLDASPSFTGRAQGLAVLPDTHEAVVGPLKARQAAAPARIQSDVNASLGPAVDPATFRSSLDAKYDQRVPPLYREAVSQPVTVDTSGVLQEIRTLGQAEKGGASTALSRAWSLLHTEADVPGVGRSLVPDRRPDALHNAKEALDAQIATVKAQQGSAARSELAALTTVRRGLNDALEAQVPGYAQANRTAQGYFQRGEAFDRGQTILNEGRDAVRPRQLAQTTAALSPKDQAAQRLRLRAEIDRYIGTTANDRVALAKAVKGEGDWNRQRLATVFGSDAAESVIGTTQREAAFAGTQNQVVENAMTEFRRQAANDVAPRAIMPSGDGNVSLAGIVGGFKGAAGAAAVKGIKIGANAVGRASDLQRNQQLAQALVQRASPEREAFMQALADRLGVEGRTSIEARRVDALVRALSQSQGERSRRALPSR